MDAMTRAHIGGSSTSLGRRVSRVISKAERDIQAALNLLADELKDDEIQVLGLKVEIDPAVGDCQQVRVLVETAEDRQHPLAYHPAPAKSGPTTIERLKDVRDTLLATLQERPDNEVGSERLSFLYEDLRSYLTEHEAARRERPPHAPAA